MEALTREAFLAKLADILAYHKATHCPRCLRIIDDGDIAWNNGSTEAGTPYASVEIICQACDTNIVHITAWAEIEDYEGILEVLENE